MSLVSLVYVSFESRTMSQQDILDILEVARKRNTEENITGMLLYRGGYFIQALEGNADAVNKLYDDIAKDARHRNVIMIYKNPITERSFSNWSMGFKNLDGVDPSTLEGYTDFLTQPITPEMLGDGSRAKAFLELFKEEANY